MEIDTKQRENYGKIASIVGILANIILAGAKIVVGALFGVLSLTADGFNNLSDCGSSLMSFVSFKLSNKPADKEHPFGHERIEYVLSMVVAFLILMIAFELLKESIGKIVSPTELSFSIIIVAVLVASILVKLALFFYNMGIAKKINSQILKATAMDSLSDCISTSTVLVAILVGKFTGVNLDGYAGILVAGFVAYSGIGILKETMSHLVGKAPDKEVVDSIKERILAHSEVYGIHDLSVYTYGPNKYFASVHIELDADVDVLESHEIVDNIEQEFFENTNIVLTGHLDPIVVNDEEVNKMRVKLADIVTDIDKDFSMHDFRMVKGPNNTNLIFDVAVPYENKLSDEEILTLLNQKVLTLDGNYRLVVRIEKQTL
ncbi:MAG: cation transporter [Clostridia bacterium]|nr:cation transporter [Clostridia bacterium]